MQHLALRPIALGSTTCEPSWWVAGRHLLIGRTSPWRRHWVGVVVKVIVFAAVVIIVWAAIINIKASVAPLDSTHVASAIILTLAVAVQRISGVQKWLSKPKDNRRDQVGDLAQATLVNVCTGRTVTEELLKVTVHVWEVPLWYRRLFPYSLRNTVRRMLAWKIFSKLETWVIRPTLRRVVVGGLKRHPPSGVKFRKGQGLIGLCIANNDKGEYLTVNTGSSSYRAALKSANEIVWESHGPKITHNLHLEDAQKLSHSYGQVIAKVVKDMETGEAIGCVTISAEAKSTQDIDLRKQLFKDGVTDLSLAVARILA